MESAGAAHGPGCPLMRRFAMLRSRLFPPPLAFLVLGCATTKPFDRSNEPGARPLSTTPAGAVVLTSEALAGESSLSILDAIRRVVPQLRGSQGAGPQRRPVLDMRGHAHAR